MTRGGDGGHADTLATTSAALDEHTTTTTAATTKATTTTTTNEPRAIAVGRHGTRPGWLVFDGRRYDISSFARRHPGGAVLTLYAGEDATSVMRAFHKDTELLRRHLAPLECGAAPDALATPSAVTRDFEALRAQLEREGAFRPRPSFFAGMLAHILALELAAWLLTYAGVVHASTAGFWLVAALLATAQAQAGWLQHDFGHLAVFASTRLNHLAHYFTLSHLKGAGKWWWVSRHQRHHAKPNVVGTDPDIDQTLPMFVFGEEYFDTDRFFVPALLPYQHLLWFLIGPPTITTVFFPIANVLLIAAQPARLWPDAVWIASFFARGWLMYAPLYSGSFVAVAKMYFAMRLLETHWFMWVTSQNHLPMPVQVASRLRADGGGDWLPLQVATTQNITSSPFVDWFTGHLNFQIEHHLFPTMPRHNYAAVAPRVRALCAKHGLAYRERSFWQACVDIVDKLRDVGRLHALRKKFSKKIM